MSNVATLTLKGVSDLKSLSTDLKSVATTAQGAATPLNSLSKSLDQSTKSATSFGQKVKNFGSTFSSSIASIGTLGGTVLNLSRQYQDLGDSQIAVDKAQLKVSKTTEASGKAQGILNGLVSKGVTSGADYEKALLDVKQALEAQSLAEQMLKERQEDHQRAQENFWIGLVPTVTSAGASIVSVLNDIGGTKGIGGLKTALGGLKGAFNVFSGAGGLASGLSGIGSAASGSVGGLELMSKGVTGLGTAMKGLALSSLPVAVALGGVALVMKSSGLVIHEIMSIMKGDMIEAVDSISKLIDFYDKLAAVAPMGAGFSIFSSLKGEAAKLKEELKGVPQAVHEIDPAFQQLDNVAKGTTTTIDSLVGGVLGLVQKADATTKATPPAAAGIASLGTSASTAAPQITALGTSLDATSGSFATITKNAPAAGVAIATVTAQTDPFNAAAVIAAKNIAAENSELALLTKSSLAGAKAFQNMAQRQQELARTLSVATQNMNKQAQAQKKLIGSSANPNYRVSNTGGAGKGPSGSHYVTFRNGKQIASGSGMAPPIKHAASGMHETVNKPTWILAGEAGSERVDIGKGGGGFNGTINVYVDGVLKNARYDINKNQGVMKG